MKKQFMDLINTCKWDISTRTIGYQWIDHLIETLYGEAVLVAQRRGDNVVLPSHFNEALQITRETICPKKSLKELANAVGGLLVGTFVAGFIPALFSGNDVIVLGYLLLTGLVGIPLMVWAFQR